MTIARGNSGANRDPDESQLQKWYWDRKSSNSAIAPELHNGSDNGQSQRTMTIKLGTARIRLGIFGLRQELARIGIKTQFGEIEGLQRISISPSARERGPKARLGQTRP